MIEQFEPTLLFSVFVFIVGLIIGSFLNVLALRLLKEEDFVFKSSHCPKCKTKIRFYDNIPVISYLFLRGKCRDCHNPISVQYPIVEFSTGILFLLCFLAFGFTIQTLGMMLVTAALIVLIVTDLYEQLIFDITSLGLIPFGLVYSLFDLGHTNRPEFIYQLLPEETTFSLGNFFSSGAIHLPGIFVSAIVGIIISIVFFEGLSYLSLILLGKHGFGMGDTKLCAGLSAWFGWELLVSIILISLVVQMFIGLPILMYNMYKDNDRKAFIASIFMVLGTIITVLINNVNIDKGIIVIVTLISFVVVIVSLLMILKRTKERQTPLYLPLGPAIAVAAFIVMFFGDSIYSAVFMANPLYLDFFHLR